MKKVKRLSFLCFLLLGIFNFSFGQEEVSKRELIALLELRAKTHGNKWTNVWDLETQISQWHGVKIKDGKVVALDLANNNLVGNLPLTIGNLTNLEYLDLSDNSLEGRMPRELRKFDGLKYLDLSGNDFKGSLPTTLNRMTDLVHLDLGNNQFDGELPESLTELSNLNSLALVDNNFTGEMPQGMANLKKLEKLYLAKNSFDNLDGLRQIAQQQLVLIDVNVNDEDLKPLHFTQAKEGLAELKFEEQY